LKCQGRLNKVQIYNVQPEEVIVNPPTLYFNDAMVFFNFNTLFFTNIGELKVQLCLFPIITEVQNYKTIIFFNVLFQYYLRFLYFNKTK
jgi:hypothetical protein